MLPDAYCLYRPASHIKLIYKTYVFYMRNIAYKKQGVPERWSRTQQKLRFFTCVTPHTKSKGLPIGGLILSKNLAFLHT
jgi:hypothetical protein